MKPKKRLPFRRPFHLSLLLLSATAPVFAQETGMPPADSQGEAPELDPLVVAATAEETRFGPPKETSVLAIPAPERELPITINSLSGDFLRDVSARRSRDVLDYIPGVNASEANGATGDIFTIRGFQTQRSFINGVRRADANYENQSRALWNIERLEVLKGPAGTESGIVEPGEFLNFVTKKPLSERAMSFDAEYGSYDYFGAYLDLTGPLARKAAPRFATDPKGALIPTAPASGDQGLFYRFIAGYEENGSFRDAFESDRFQIAPSLLWKYGEDRSLLVEVEFQPLGHAV